MSNIYSEEITLAPGAIHFIGVPGEFWHIKDSSGPLDVEPLGQAKERDARAGAKQSYGERFAKVKFTNRSTTQTVKAKVSVGDGNGSDSADYSPLRQSTKPRGKLIQALAVNDSVTVEGVDEQGNRREYITISLKPSTTGAVHVYNSSNELIAIIGASSAGGGWREYTDDDLTITNRTGGPISSDTATPDIAVAQNFYRQAV